MIKYYVIVVVLLATAIMPVRADENVQPPWFAVRERYIIVPTAYYAVVGPEIGAQDDWQMKLHSESDFGLMAPGRVCRCTAPIGYGGFCPNDQVTCWHEVVFVPSMQ